MLIDIHMLKNYPPVNLNRDDTGSPKTCWFGGVQRGRISSQCQKRSWRDSALYESELSKKGIRTFSLKKCLRIELEKRGCDDAFIDAAIEKEIGFPYDSKEPEYTKQIVFFSDEDIKCIADALISVFADTKNNVEKFKKESPEKITKILKQKASVRPITLDIALFGRMVTTNTLRTVEASIQVAHAISTHAVFQESDYFTATDDLLSDDGKNITKMLGDIDFNSCCYYQYVSIDTDQLRENLKDSPDCEELIKKLVPAFIRIMSFTDPSGKQNSFAGHVLPSLLCVEIKPDKIPVSYANAFAKPVNVRKGNVVGESVAAIVSEINKQDKAFGIESKRFWFSPDAENAPEKAEVCASLNELCESISREMVSAPEFRG